MKKDFQSFLFLGLCAFSQNAFALQNTESKGIRLEQSSPTASRIHFSLPKINLETVDVSGKIFANLSIKDWSNLDVKGYPALPYTSFDIALPNDVISVQSHLEHEVWRSLPTAKIVSSKGQFDRSQNPQEIAYSFSGIYESNKSFPGSALKSGSIFTFRDVKGTNVRLVPFKYDFGTGMLSILESADIVIEANRPIGASSVAEMSGTSNVDESFASVYSNHFVNFDTSVQDSSDRGMTHFVKVTNKVLIVTHPKFEAGLADFVKWKIEKGLDVAVVKIASSGATYNDVSTIIKKHYADQKISYVILVGDAEDMPYFPGKSGNAVAQEADPMYGLLEGTDSYPEAFISRISAKTVDDVKNSLNKAIIYESKPDVDGKWYSTALGIASDQDGGSGLKDWQRLDLIKEMIMKWNYLKFVNVYDPSGTKKQVSDALNSGVGYISYTGHGSTTAWGSTGFSTTDIDKLTNSNKLPFIVSVACVNGNFKYSGSDSFAERWIKAGTVAEPKGAVAIFASSTNQSWVPPTVGQKAIAELMVNKTFSTIGSLFTHGSVAVLEDNSSTAAQTFETWHTFGDGTAQIRTQSPKNIVVDFDRAIKEGAKTVSFDVKEEGISLGLTINGRYVGSTISSKDGVATVELCDCPKAGDKVKVVATGFDKIPYSELVDVTL